MIKVVKKKNLISIFIFLVVITSIIVMLSFKKTATKVDLLEQQFTFQDYNIKGYTSTFTTNDKYGNLVTLTSNLQYNGNIKLIAGGGGVSGVAIEVPRESKIIITSLDMREIEKMKIICSFQASGATGTTSRSTSTYSIGLTDGTNVFGLLSKTRTTFDGDVSSETLDSHDIEITNQGNYRFLAKDFEGTSGGGNVDLDPNKEWNLFIKVSSTVQMGTIFVASTIEDFIIEYPEECSVDSDCLSDEFDCGEGFEKSTKCVNNKCQNLCIEIKEPIYKNPYVIVGSALSMLTSLALIFRKKIFQQ